MTKVVSEKVGVDTTVEAIAMLPEGFFVQWKGIEGWHLLAPVVWDQDTLAKIRKLVPGKPCPTCGKKVGRRTAKSGKSVEEEE